MKRLIFMIAQFMGVLSLSACASVSFFVANAPVPFAEAKKFENISYGPHTWQKLDIYVPEKLSSPAPVFVFFHGGRWSFGNKEQYAFTALEFVKKGYIVVIPDYAKYPRVKFPAFVEDTAAAIAWVHDHIQKYGGNEKNLFVGGHSSGAHMAALVAADPSYLKAHGKSRSIITGFAGLAGPYDFIPEDPDLKDMFGPPENYYKMQVPSFIDGKQPPMLLLHGRDDQDVILRNLYRLRDKINEKGGVVKTKIYDGIDHKEIVGALSWVWRDKAPVAEDVDSFFKSQMGQP